jgi:hypothetical protein
MPQDLTNEDRAAFEAWAKSPPLEWNVARYPDDPALSEWPGLYRRYETQCAWASWQEGMRAGMERAAKVCDELSFRASICMAERDNIGEPVYDQESCSLGIQATNECAVAIRALLREGKRD